MEQQNIHINERQILQTLLGRFVQFEQQIENMNALILQKINPTTKEFVDDAYLETNFGFSHSIRSSLVRKKIIGRYKIGGQKNSKSFYKLSEILDQIEKGLIAPTKKIAS